MFTLTYILYDNENSEANEITNEMFVQGIITAIRENLLRSFSEFVQTFFQLIVETNKAADLKCDSRLCFVQLRCQKTSLRQILVENRDLNRPSFNCNKQLRALREFGVLKCKVSRITSKTLGKNLKKILIFYL